MTEAITVEVLRDGDREPLKQALRDWGVEAHVTEEGVLEIPCDGDFDRLCDEIRREVEAWIAETGLPLVPEQVEDGLVLRPPGS